MAHVSIIIPIRNRYDYRIKNALESLRGQSYPSELIDIYIVDYGSSEKFRPVFDELMSRYDVKGIWTGIKVRWNKSHCLNIALKDIKTSFVQICDVDIIFEQNYIQTCIAEFTEEKNLLVYSDMLDTTEGEVTDVINYPGDYKSLREKTVYRGKRLNAPNLPFGTSLLFARTVSLQNIRGYDEHYELWGDEDWDMQKRLELSGLTLVNVSAKTSHIHQWHIRFENVGNVQGFENQVAKNRHYFLQTNTVPRNLNGWGEIHHFALFHWQPEGFLNFGDELFPMICSKIIGEELTPATPQDHHKFLAGGSILHFARNGDVVWGVGIRDTNHIYDFTHLDIRSVRGPITRDFLISKGIACPPIYGDPALLLPLLFPELKAKPVAGIIGIVPHFRDVESLSVLTHPFKLILPTWPKEKVIDEILSSEFIISSSLHGIVVAEAFGIPARWLQFPTSQPEIKFHDYFLGTGRTSIPAHTIEQAVNMGGEKPITNFDVQLLRNAFPKDILLRTKKNNTP